MKESKLDFRLTSTQRGIQHNAILDNKTQLYLLLYKNAIIKLHLGAIEFHPRHTIITSLNWQQNRLHGFF